MVMHEDKAIESFCLSITPSGDGSGGYDLQWEIITLTSVQKEIKEGGMAHSPYEMTYGDALIILAYSLGIMSPG